MKFFFLIFCLIVSNIFPQRANPDMWITNGDVRSIAVDGNYTYIGGLFTYVGPNTGRGCKLTTESVLPNMSYPKVNGSIEIAVPDGSGGWYIGGYFTKVGTEIRNHIARINSDGTLNSWNPNAGGGGVYPTVSTIAVIGSDVYVGGDFTTIGGHTRNRIAKLNNTTGEPDINWNANIIGNDVVVYSIVASGSDIYVGGKFTSIGGRSRNHIAKLNSSTGAADAAWNANANNFVYTIAVIGSDIYAGGEFTSIGSVTRNHIAKLNNSTGAADLIWNPNIDGAVRKISLTGSDIYAGGQFTSVGGQARNYLAKINNTTGAVDLTWNPSPNDFVYTIASSGSDIFVGGKFSSIGGQSRNFVAKLNNSTGAPDPLWNPNAEYIVNSIAINGSDIYVGGLFKSISGQNRNCLAKLNNTTGKLDLTWNPNINSEYSYTIIVLSLAVSDSNIYVGGHFGSIGGLTRNNIAKLNNSNGAPDPTWNPGANNWVWTIALSESDIYVGGEFTIINDQSRKYLAKVNKNTGAVDLTFNPNVGGGDWGYTFVKTIAVSGSDIYAGGNFTLGQIRKNIAKLNNFNGAPYPTWNPNANAPVNTIAVSGSDIYAGGVFDSIGGQSKYRIAKLNNTTGQVDLTWNPNPSGGSSFYSITANGSDIYTGGIFESIGGQTRHDIARLNNITGEADLTWNPNSGGLPYSIVVTGSDIYLGGDFGEMGDQIQPSLALFTDRVLPVQDISLNASSFELDQNYPNPFNPKTTISYSLSKSGNVSLEVYDLLGRRVASLVNEYKPSGNYKVNFNASNLASGIYIYQIKTNDFISSKKMIVLK